MASEGIFRKVKLLLDKLSAQSMERDAQTALKKGTDPTAAKQNLNQVDSAFERIKATAVRVGTAIAAAFAIHKIVAFAEESVRAAAQAEQGWKQLANTLKDAGDNAGRELPRLKKLADEFQRSTRFDDDAFVEGMTRSIRITGSRVESLKLVGLASDVAVAKQIDFAEAMEKVSRIQAGETRGLKEFGITTKDAAAGLEELSKRLAGTTATDLETFGGKVEQVKNQWDDLKKAFGEGLIGGDNTTTLEQTRDTIERVTPTAQALGAVLRESVLFLLKAAEGWRLIFQFASDHMPGAADRNARASLRAEDWAAEERRQAILDLIAYPNKTKPATSPPKTASAPAGPRLPSSSPRVPGIAGGVVGGGLLGGIGSGIDIFDTKGAQEELDQLAAAATEAWITAHDDIIQSMGSVAGNVESAFGRMFDVLLTGSHDAGDAFKELGKGIAGSMIGAVHDFAGAHERKEFANAIEEIALGFGALAHADPRAALHFKSAAGHTAAGVAWAALAGGAGSAQYAVGGGGGAPSASSSPAANAAANVPARGIIVQVFIDPLSPSDPAYVRNVAATMAEVKATYGENAIVTVHPRTGR